jgi:hypothetical protein
MGWSAFFFSFRDSLFRDYNGLFREGESTDGDEDSPQDYESKKAEEFAKRWSWYDIISKQVDDDPLKIKQMFDLELKFILNHLSYKLSKKQ